MSAATIEAFLPGRSHLADQMHRTAVSVSFNIAEGAGEFSKGEKLRFYSMAKRSGTESGAALDLCRELQITTAFLLIEARDILIKIVSMLVKLLRSDAIRAKGWARAEARAPAASRLGTEEAGGLGLLGNFYRISAIALAKHLLSYGLTLRNEGVTR
jgi:four helix bundle protein